jgi:uncharacterized protein
MQINVSQLLREAVGSVRNCAVKKAIDIAGSRSMVEGQVRLMRTNRSILAKGTLHTTVNLTCSRCLALFDYPLTLNIEEEYFPTTDIASGASLLLPDETSGFAIDEQHILDLTEAVQQYALLAIPMKPLCCQDCAGLCPNCGHNLNQGPCNCPAQKLDPRWSKLRELASVSGTLVNNGKGRK